MAQDNPGGATPSTPTLIQRVKEWFEITRLLILACIALAMAYGQAQVADARRDYEQQTLKAEVLSIKRWQERQEEREQDKAEKLTRALTLLEALGHASRRQP